MGSAEVVAPPPPEFRRVYHLTTAEYAINDIGLGRMKIARFRELNDPFELGALNYIEWRDHKKAVVDFQKTTNETIGLLCFSGDWTSPVLWSHYADKHRGICLGFNLTLARAQRVRYEAERIGIARLSQGVSIDEALESLLLCTKFKEWEYEEEWRVILPLEGQTQEGHLHFHSFDIDLELAEVILGPLCNHSLSEVRRLVEAHYPKAITFKGRLASKHFKIVPDERSLS